MRLRRLLAASLCVCACGARRGTVENPKVARVEVEGNRAFGDGEITEGLQTRPPSGFLFFKKRATFDPIALELDRERVEAFYRERGYFSARVVDVDVEAIERGVVGVKIVVEEGEPTQIAAVRIDGPRKLDLEALRERADLERGEVLDHPEYLLAKDRIRADLLRDGYAHAKVDGTVEVNRDTRQAVVRLRIDPGPLVRFGKTKIEGLEWIPPSAVRARVAWEEGDRFDPAAIERTQARLYQLGYFSTVRIQYEGESRPAVSDVTIRVSEGLRHEIRLGGGVGYDRSRAEVHGRAQYVVRGFLDPLLLVRLDARPGYTFRGTGGEQGPSAEASVTLEKLDFLLPTLTGRTMAAYDVEPFEAYQLRGPRLVVGLEKPFLDDRLRVHAGWTYESLTFFDVDPVVLQEGWRLDDYRLGFYTLALAWDTRDRPLDAQHGIYASVGIEGGGPWAGGAFEYVRVTPELRLYVPIGRRLVIAGRAMGGRFLLGEGDAETPVTRRYFGGGASGHRGFGYRRLSPMLRGEEGLIPTGGAEMLETSLEARWAAFVWRDSWVSFVTFLDAGDVTHRNELQLDDLHLAAGVGARYDTVIGPVRIDVGFRLNRWEPAGPEGLDNPDPGTSTWDRVAIHFSLGEAF